MSTVYTFYAGDGISFLNLRFENDVKIYGIQTKENSGHTQQAFENDVKIMVFKLLSTEKRNPKCMD